MSDSKYTMVGAANTSSSNGALNQANIQVKQRQTGGKSFVPPSGMSGGDVGVLAGIAGTTEQGVAHSKYDKVASFSGCGGSRKRRRKTKRKRRRKIKRRRTKRTKRRRTKRRRTKRRRKRRGKELNFVRFSKMPPKYL
jgi:transposase